MATANYFRIPASLMISSAASSREEKKEKEEKKKESVLRVIRNSSRKNDYLILSGQRRCLRRAIFSLPRVITRDRRRAFYLAVI